MKKYTLVGVDGNAFSIMGYTSRALKDTGNGHLVDQMREEAMSGDYNHLIAVCDKYIDIANKGLVSSSSDTGDIVRSPSKKFYVGDICYAMRDDIYDEVWGSNNYEDGYYSVDLPDGSKSSFMVHGTAYGDGGYPSMSGFTYGVDAGVLGIVPAELFNSKPYGGKFFEGDEMTMEVDDNYTFRFYLDGDLVEEIYTMEDEEDEEDWYEDDDEYYDDDEEEEDY